DGAGQGTRVKAAVGADGEAVGQELCARQAVALVEAPYPTRIGIGAPQAAWRGRPDVAVAVDGEVALGERGPAVRGIEAVGEFQVAIGDRVTFERTEALQPQR